MGKREGSIQISDQRSCPSKRSSHRLLQQTFSLAPRLPSFLLPASPHPSPKSLFLMLIIQPAPFARQRRPPRAGCCTHARCAVRTAGHRCRALHEHPWLCHALCCPSAQRSKLGQFGVNFSLSGGSSPAVSHHLQGAGGAPGQASPAQAHGGTFSPPQLLFYCQTEA